MFKDFMMINEGELLPVHRVRRVMPATERDIKSLSDLEGVIDPTKYNSKVDIAKQGEFFVTQTLKDFKNQGINFVQVSDKAYVPTDNIVRAKDLNEQDRTDFERRTTRQMPDAFKSKLSTVAGTVLADVSAKEVLGRMSQPFIPPKQKPFGKPDKSNNKDDDIDAGL